MKQSLIGNEGVSEEQSTKTKSLEAEIDNIRKEIRECLKGLFLVKFLIKSLSDVKLFLKS